MAGSFILPLLRDLRLPVVTALHTVLLDLDADQRWVLRELSTLSSRLVVMGERGRQMLREMYGVPDEQIDLIPTVFPICHSPTPDFYKDQFGVEGKQVLLTFGLLSPNKSIECTLRALPAIMKEFPNLVYTSSARPRPT